MPGSVRVELRGLLGGAVHDPVDLLHQVERRTDDRRVLAEGRRPGHRDRGVGERGDDAELPRHVVRRGQHVAQRRPAQHPLLVAVAEQVGQVRPSAGHDLAAQGPGGAAGQHTVEMPPEPHEVEPRQAQAR